MDKTKRYEAQKKHLAEKKQLRVWMDAEKFEKYKETASERGESIYGVINAFVDDYLK